MLILFTTWPTWGRRRTGDIFPSPASQCIFVSVNKQYTYTVCIWGSTYCQRLRPRAFFVFLYFHVRWMSLARKRLPICTPAARYARAIWPSRASSISNGRTTHFKLPENASERLTTSATESLAPAATVSLEHSLPPRGSTMWFVRRCQKLFSTHVAPMLRVKSMTRFGRQRGRDERILTTISVNNGPFFALEQLVIDATL